MTMPDIYIELYSSTEISCILKFFLIIMYQMGVVLGNFKCTNLKDKLSSKIQQELDAQLRSHFLFCYINCVLFTNKWQ